MTSWNKLAIATLVFSTSLGAQTTTNHDNELALIESWLNAQRAYDRVPAVSASIVHDQELLWSGASGLADIERKREAKADTIYGICSISKLFTGIAVMQLRDQGKLALDDTLPDLLPWFNLQQSYPDSPSMSLRAALTHSAGLPRESDHPYWQSPDFIFPTYAEIKQELGQQSTLYPADRYHQYSNLGLTLVGEVVAQKSGEDYNSYVQKHILTPLKLSDTDTGFPTDSRQERIATGYAFPDRDGAIEIMPRYDAKGITPAAGFSSTALDLASFASWQFRVRAGEDQQVLAGNTLREMQRVQWMDWDWKNARGLAFGVYRVGDHTLTGHAGSCPGFNTRTFLDPQSLYAVNVLANRNGVDVDGYARVMFDILKAGGSTTSAESDTPANQDLDEYPGSYDLTPWYGELLVFRWNDGLAFVGLPTMDPVNEMTVLKRIEGDQFRTVRSDDTLGHEVIFLRDETGKVSHMKQHALSVPKM